MKLIKPTLLLSCLLALATFIPVMAEGENPDTQKPADDAGLEKKIETLISQLDAWDAALRRKALERLNSLGNDALPLLEKYLESEKPSIRKCVEEFFHSRGVLTERELKTLEESIYLLVLGMDELGPNNLPRLNLKLRALLEASIKDFKPSREQKTRVLRSKDGSFVFAFGADGIDLPEACKGEAVEIKDDKARLVLALGGNGCPVTVNPQLQPDGGNAKACGPNLVIALGGNGGSLKFNIKGALGGAGKPGDTKDSKSDTGHCIGMNGFSGQRSGPKELEALLQYLPPEGFAHNSVEFQAEARKRLQDAGYQDIPAPSTLEGIPSPKDLKDFLGLCASNKMIAFGTYLGQKKVMGGGIVKGTYKVERVIKGDGKLAGQEIPVYSLADKNSTDRTVWRHLEEDEASVIICRFHDKRWNDTEDCWSATLLEGKAGKELLEREFMLNVALECHRNGAIEIPKAQEQFGKFLERQHARKESLETIKAIEAGLKDGALAKREAALKKLRVLCWKDFGALRSHCSVKENGEAWELLNRKLTEILQSDACYIHFRPQFHHAEKILPRQIEPDKGKKGESVELWKAENPRTVLHLNGAMTEEDQKAWDEAEKMKSNFGFRKNIPESKALKDCLAVKENKLPLFLLVDEKGSVIQASNCFLELLHALDKS